MEKLVSAECTTEMQRRAEAGGSRGIHALSTHLLICFELFQNCDAYASQAAAYLKPHATFLVDANFDIRAYPFTFTIIFAALKIKRIW
jgi:hypothetical protein